MGANAQGSADERLAGNLRALREEAGMTQAALAAAMAERGRPWHQSTVYRVESGRQAVTFGEASDLAAILKTSLDRFARPTAEASEAQYVYAAGTDVRLSSENAAAAVCRLLAAVARAERVLESSAGSEWPRVQAAREDTAVRLEDYGLDEAVAEGIRRHLARGGTEGGEDDGAEDSQGEPGVVDQREAE